ncbi:MAG: MotA/TolQ/ExbB proton channel family protein [Polyangiaceae bacterium]
MSFSLVHIWASMGLLSKLVASSLLLMAAMSIAVTIERWITLARGKAATGKFLAAATPALERGDLESVSQFATDFKAAPFARIVGPTIRKMLKADTGEVSLVELARRESERQRESVSGELRRGLGVLASVGSIAPFVGLLGTVVGIISAFQGIAASGSGGLGSVSAGISEALVETALGLCVAIPAVLLFNNLNAKLNAEEGVLARASGELLDELENKYGNESVPKLRQAA